MQVLHPTPHDHVCPHHTKFQLCHIFFNKLSPCLRNQSLRAVSALKANCNFQSTQNPTTPFVNPTLSFCATYRPEFLPTPFLQIPHGNFPEFSASLPAPALPYSSLLWLSHLTLSPLCSIPSLPLPDHFK